ncbi:hypothetical protein PACID_28000 [Acidipropionibacterium acidipropionici ATCC 4875]|uniref:Uncharacterized protein n=1 Tax=Acidipropionibacterium acidipropionici (strain ATCC 4875 / DSM 20272 / JCM 6432 / NBRC 12425 / NCIMB 8070 / 4) TaxID=1171373 RepID=K7S7I6_ACIA4|nr:hypothetical protein PACID_28000 [Acidipropionibacterium acidipropionici ATCC 4875]
MAARSLPGHGTWRRLSHPVFPFVGCSSTARLWTARHVALSPDG